MKVKLVLLVLVIALLGGKMVNDVIAYKCPWCFTGQLVSRCGCSANVSCTVCGYGWGCYPHQCAAQQTLAAELLSSSNNQASADQPQPAEA